MTVAIINAWGLFLPYAEDGTNRYAAETIEHVAQLEAAGQDRDVGTLL